MTQSSVYFIRLGDNGLVKIGYSIDPTRRLMSLQTGFAGALSMMRTLSGGRAAERWLHGHFASLRVAGEWFHFRHDMMTIDVPSSIQTIDISDGTDGEREETEISTPAWNASDDFIFEVIEAVYGGRRRAERFLAADAGSSFCAARNWLQRRNAPQSSYLLRLMVARPQISNAIIEFVTCWQRSLQSGNVPEGSVVVAPALGGNVLALGAFKP